MGLTRDLLGFYVVELNLCCTVSPSPNGTIPPPISRKFNVTYPVNY